MNNIDKKHNDKLLQHLNTDLEGILEIFQTCKVYGSLVCVSYLDSKTKTNMSAFGLGGNITQTLQATHSGIKDLFDELDLLKDIDGNTQH